MSTDESVSDLGSSTRDPLFLAAVVVAVLVLLAWVVITLVGSLHQSSVADADKTLAQLNQQLKDPGLQTTVTQYSALDAVTTQMAKVRAKRVLFSPSWDAIKASVPADVQFTSVTFTQDNIFRISGVTKSITSVAHFAKALSTNPHFSQVTPLSVDKQNQAGLFNFSLSFKAQEGNGS